MRLQTVFTYSDLYDAYGKLSGMHKEQNNKIKFNYYLEDQLFTLLHQLQSGEFAPKQLSTKIIYEPKKRTIQIPAIADKIVQHLICDNYLLDAVSKVMIKETSACLTGRGTEYANALVKKQLIRYYHETNSKDFYSLKCDIKSFFQTINLARTKKLVDRYVKDKEVHNIVNKFLDITDIGLPLGFQQSQLLANLYLSELDHICKQKLHAKFYGRHMDDFYIISDNLEYLQSCLKNIQDYVESIGLQLNPKTKITKNSLDFIGFTFFLTDSGKVICRKEKNKKKQKYRHLKKQIKQLGSGEITPEHFAMSYQGCRASLQKYNTHALLQSWDNMVTKELLKLGYHIKITKKRVIIECQHKEHQEI